MAGEFFRNLPRGAFTLKKFSKENETFKKACAQVQIPGKKEKGILPTERQASKFLRRKGIAYKTIHSQRNSKES